MWLQTIAIVLPRVQEHYSISDNLIGILSSSLFAGMTFGAFFWGTYSDAKGRKVPYTMTLLITSVFGTLASFTFNFFTLCLCLFFLGFGVGGNMPTDGALYLEFLPKEYHYLLTFMSVFFSLGAVLASVFGYVILPCEGPCDDNRWRMMLFVIAMMTFFMLAIRTFLLKLPETPKFLMNQGKTNETIIVLQDIARMNGDHVHIDKDDLSTSMACERYEELHDTTDEVSPMLLETQDEDDKQEKGTQALKELLGPKWRKTTLLIWLIWTFTSVAYTMFNVFLPKFLETVQSEEAKPTLAEVYWDYLIYSLAGMPGSVIASYLVETSFGRKGTMAISAIGSSLSLLVFSVFKARLIMVLSSSSVSFLATLLYAVIYGYTPEVFNTSVRGTAVGTASALGRVAGIISPLLAGFLFIINMSLPLYVSVGGYLIVGVCILMLPFETRRK
ncbi:hypothetical protein CU097_013048 [Rhizopus azygosporus]|nr:hypothetical protein CU097_013048 [Rhizopus azygosporus]